MGVSCWWHSFHPLPCLLQVPIILASHFPSPLNLLSGVSDTNVHSCAAMLPTVSLFYWQRKPRGTLSMKRISRKSSKHKSLLKRVHRQMMKEQRSGLFENEEVRQWHPLKNNHLVSRKAFFKIPYYGCCISGTIKNNFTSLSKLI